MSTPTARVTEIRSHFSEVDESSADGPGAKKIAVNVSITTPINAPNNIRASMATIASKVRQVRDYVQALDYVIANSPKQKKPTENVYQFSEVDDSIAGVKKIDISINITSPVDAPNDVRGSVATITMEICAIRAEIHILERIIAAAKTK